MPVQHLTPTQSRQIRSDRVYKCLTANNRGACSENLNNEQRCIDRITQYQMERRYIVAKRRSEQGKLIRRQYKNDIGVPYQLCKGYSLKLDGVSNCITTVITDNWILELSDKNIIDDK